MAISSRDARRQVRAGRGSHNPGRYIPREMPEGPELDTSSNEALAPMSDIMRRADELGVRTTDRPSGEIARSVALTEALAAAGADPAAADPPPGPAGTGAGTGAVEPAVTRAARAVAGGERPEAAILAAVAAGTR